MPSTMPRAKARVEPLTPLERLSYDAVSTSPRADLFVLDYVNVEPLEAFRQDWVREKGGTGPSLMMCVARASAIALDEFPEVQHFITRSRRHVPGTTDIGITVLGGDDNVHPIVVLRDAGRLSLTRLLEEFPRAMRQALRDLRRDIPRINRFGRWVPLLRWPFNTLRRRAMAWLNLRPEMIWRVVGTFHITGVGTESVDWAMPLFRTTTSLMAVGSVAPRAVVEEGQVVVRQTVPISVCSDHRAVDARKLIRFLGRVREILEDPATRLHDLS